MMENHCYEQAAQRVETIRKQIAQAAKQAGRDPSEIRLMAVTKTRTAEEVNEVIAAGITLLGFSRENRFNIYSVSHRLKGCSLPVPDKTEL